MNVEEYSYLWNGSDPGWALYYKDHTVWNITLLFGKQGPDKVEIFKAHKLLPELRILKLPEVYRILKGQSEYISREQFGNIEAKRIEAYTHDLGLTTRMAAEQLGGYLPVYKNKSAIIIENEEILRTL